VLKTDPYHDVYEQMVDLWKYDLSTHPTGGMRLYERNGRVHMASIEPGTTAARIHDWRTRI
jgi:hypothetical protein